MFEKKFGALERDKAIELGGEPTANTYSDYGRIVAPNGGDEIAGLEGLEPGFYDVTCWTAFGATVAVGDEDNYSLFNHGAKVATLLTPPVANQLPMPFRLRRVYLADGNLQIKAIVAGTAGAIYKAMLTAVKVA